MSANPQTEKIDLAPILAERMTLSMLFDLAEKGREAYYAQVREVDRNWSPEAIAKRDELRHCWLVAKNNYNRASKEYWARLRGEEADYRDEKADEESYRRGG